MPHKFLIEMRDDQFEQLKAISDDTGVSISRYIRQGIDLLLNSREPGSIAISGFIVSGQILVISR